jgi:hypothetical protein
MPKFLLQNHAGHQFIQEGRNLFEAKMNLCRRLGDDWKDPEIGAASLRVVEEIKE